TMATRALKPEGPEERRQRLRGAGIDREFEEGEAADLGRRGRIEKFDSLEDVDPLAGLLRPGGRPELEARARLCLEEEQRLHGVDRGAPVGRLAKQIVEYLERQRAAVTREEHLLQKAREVELTLTREATVVTAPLQNVHREAGRIGELQEEDFFARD